MNADFKVGRSLSNGGYEELFQGTEYKAQLFLQHGKYGYTQATIVIDTETLIGALKFEPKGLFAVGVGQATQNGIIVSAVLDDMLIESVYHHANGRSYIHFRHSDWFGLTQSTPYFSMNTKEDIKPTEFLAEYLRDCFNVATIGKTYRGTIEEQKGMSWPNLQTQFDLRNYDLIGKRGVDVLDEICYKGFLEWGLANLVGQAACVVGEFPAAMDINNTIYLDQAQYFPIVQTKSDVYSFDQESHAPILLDGGYFQLEDSLPDQSGLNPFVMVARREASKTVKYPCQLVTIEIKKNLAITRYYVSAGYVSPFDYFKVFTPGDSFAIERMNDFARVRHSVAFGNIRRAKLFKADTTDILDVQMDASGLTQTKTKFDDKDKAVLLKKVQRTTPFARKNAFMLFPEPEEDDEPTSLVLKPDCDNGKMVAIGEIVPVDVNTDKQPGDFVLEFSDGSTLRYEKEGKKWILTGTEIKIGEGTKKAALEDHKHQYIMPLPPFQSGPNNTITGSDSNTSKTVVG